MARFEFFFGLMGGPWAWAMSPIWVRGPFSVGPSPDRGCVVARARMDGPDLPCGPGSDG